ncbi:52 kDa repressor of the inhibitor of the protein kinase-like [Pseudophryne corroboree]|uniref:52 kDa repressor of the inhibitor of the protein kinase-like n=1 Tax=Pseudophryne corroboree TaxID=495146 RepID=UPI0030821B5F
MDKRRPDKQPTLMKFFKKLKSNESTAKSTENESTCDDLENTACASTPNPIEESSPSNVFQYSRDIGCYVSCTQTIVDEERYKVLREEGGRSHVKLGKLVLEPLCSYKDAKNDFRVHEKNEYHKNNLLRSQNFIDIMDGKISSIEALADSAIRRRIESNRQKLIPIIKTILFCGMNNIPLRGHRDDGSIFTEDSDDKSVTKGNFKALLRFRIDAGDKILESHLQTAGKNSTFISKTTQNDLITCCGEILQTKIVDKMKMSKFYSILADETTYISISEQLPFCVRYLDTGNCCVEERFLGFTKVVNMTGEALSDSIIESLKSANLDIAYLRGQGYDGGANMSGLLKGVQAQILRMQPLAIYTNCANHRLNLALNKASTVTSIRITVGIIANINNFLRDSAFRMHLLSDKINEMLPSQKAVKAKKLCETRWVERHDGILHFLEILPAVVGVLEDIGNSTSTNAASNAQSLLAVICKFEFLVSLKILSKILAITLPLSVQLQTVNVDFGKSVEMVEFVKSALRRIRQHSEDEFKILFGQTKVVADNLDVEVKLPKVRNVHQHRANLTEMEDYFRVNTFLPYLDYLISELESRFSQDNTSHMAKLQKIIAKYYFESDTSDADILEAAKKYESDLPSTVQVLEGELKLWREFWAMKSEKVDTAMEAYKLASMFPNIRTLLIILCVIPVTTATAERSFSSLKRIKTYLISTMGQERLNGLAMLNIHNDIELAPEEVLDVFAVKHSRKLQLQFI